MQERYIMHGHGEYNSPDLPDIATTTMGDNYAGTPGQYAYPDADPCAPACAPPKKRTVSHCDITHVSAHGVVSEFLGTVWLMLVIGAARAMYSYGPIGGVGGVVAVALATAFAIVVACKGLGWMSGGHFNPAITLAALLAHRLTVLRALFFWIAQFVGALAGAGLLRLFVYDFDATLGTPVPVAGLTAGRAFGVEIVAMFFLTLFMLTSSKRGAFNPAVYGYGFGAVTLFLQPLTGASLNPALQLASAIVANVWTSAWVYYVAAFGGAIAAALLYMFFAIALQAKEHDKRARFIGWVKAAERM